MDSSRWTFEGSFTGFADGLYCTLTLEPDGERGLTGSLRLGDLTLALRGMVADRGANGGEGGVLEEDGVAHGLVLEPGGALRALWRAAPHPGGIALELRVPVPESAPTPTARLGVEPTPKPTPKPSIG